MNENELRIGNLVKWVGDSEPREITLFTLHEWYDHERSGDGTYGDYILPIPITEEWLKRLGFKVYANCSVSKRWAIGKNPITHDYLLTLTWMKNENGTLAECFYLNGHFVIKYVHELQNLFFSITRVELELKEKSDN